MSFTGIHENIPNSDGPYKRVVQKKNPDVLMYTILLSGCIVHCMIQLWYGQFPRKEDDPNRQKKKA